MNLNIKEKNKDSAKNTDIDRDLLKSISEAKLSKVSKHVYLERLKTLVSELDKSIYWILSHPKAALDWIEKRSDALTTQKSYIVAILAVFKHNEGLKAELKSDFDKWYTKFTEIDEKITDKYKQNEPSEKQLSGFVEFKDIIAKRDTLEDDTFDKLLLGFYTYLKPLRADFNAVKIYHGSISKKEDDQEPNYIVISKNKHSATLILTEFKTQRSHKEFSKELPAELLKLLLISLDKRPREWLFVDKFGNPYKEPNSYTRWANRTFLKLFDKPLTITLIRHSFISSLDQNALTTAEKEEIAHEMAHSRGMQELYRFVKK